MRLRYGVPGADSSGMAMRTRPFTATGQVIAADEADAVKGLVFTGFTAVTVYDGVDATGNVVLAATAPGSYSYNEGVFCEKGVYVVVAGVGKGSILV